MQGHDYSDERRFLTITLGLSLGIFQPSSSSLSQPIMVGIDCTPSHSIEILRDRSTSSMLVLFLIPITLWWSFVWQRKWKHSKMDRFGRRSCNKQPEKYKRFRDENFERTTQLKWDHLLIIKFRVMSTSASQVVNRGENYKIRARNSLPSLFRSLENIPRECEIFAFISYSNVIFAEFLFSFYGNFFHSIQGLK